MDHTQHTTDIEFGNKRLRTVRAISYTSHSQHATKPVDLWSWSLVLKRTYALTHPFPETNCTIDITDPLYHLLEFYVHNDAPLTCRVPARPIPSLSSPSTQDQPLSSSSTTSTTPYVPLIFALTGTLQSSHLHISSALNLLLHTAPPAVSPGTIDAATAYATSAAPGVQAQIIIGDRLPLRLSVRWFVGTQLPPNLRPGSSLGLGGHVFWSTAVYCALSAGAATAVCTVWFRGVELPRRLRSYQRESVRGERGGGGYNGYALSGAGYGFGGGGGKRD
ncbi:MAG: hypothetical protein M1822_005089 [Bathelium mastoideum]|nr:MAG: hypothetical protein M1822_005089 [Bathelium mastoideum]